MLAVALFFIIPAVMYVLSFVIIKYSDENSPSRLRRWLNSARQPIHLRSLLDEDIQQVPEIERVQYVKDGILSRLLAVYLFIGLLLLTNIIGTFYNTMADVIMPIGNAGEEEIRVWSAIVITTPFSGGWTGTFPWYGFSFWPPAYPEVYHETWNWVYHTTALVTGNDYFFQGISQDLFILPLIVGIVFLIPLARKSVREAFLPSILHFHVAMLTIMSTVFNCFSEAFKLEILSNTITFGNYVVGAADLNGLPASVISTLVPVLLVAFMAFFGLSYKLAETHYSTSTRGKWLFVANTSILYWLSFIMVILV